MQIKAASANSLIIYLGDEISKVNAQKVSFVYNYLKSLDDDSLYEIIPSYTTVFLSFDIFKWDFKSLKTFLENNIDFSKTTINEGKLINIDVYYGQEVGLDLQRISKYSNLSIEEIIHIHSSKVYDVYAIGFLPGFAYLASVDSRIAMSRLESPRKLIPKGSVSIADTQTAVYPATSPGGWNVVGKTAFEFFDKSLENLSLVHLADKIKFNPISKEEFLSQGGSL
jgi:KipI family sensor histidine kinase inhibitor